MARAAKAGAMVAVVAMVAMVAAAMGAVAAKVETKAEILVTLVVAGVAIAVKVTASGWAASETEMLEMALLLVHPLGLNSLKRRLDPSA